MRESLTWTTENGSNLTEGTIYPQLSAVIAKLLIAIDSPPRECVRGGVSKWTSAVLLLVE